MKINLSAPPCLCVSATMKYSIRFIEKTTVKGKSKAVAVFEVFDGEDLDLKHGKLVTKPLHPPKFRKR